MESEVERARQQGLSGIVIAGWTTTAMLAVLALSLGREAAIAAFLSAIANALPTLHRRTGRLDESARLATAVLPAVQPALLIFVMDAGGLQMQMHLSFSSPASPRSSGYAIRGPSCCPAC